MFNILTLGLVCSAALTGLGVALTSGLVGHPFDGQVPGDWGWSFVMMGVACAFACGFFEWQHFKHRP